MIHYNNHNDAYCWAVSAETFEKIEHNTVQMSTLVVIHKKQYSYSKFEIFVCIRGEMDQLSTNTSRYTTCCAANVYMFVYIFIGVPIVPLNKSHQTKHVHTLTKILHGVPWVFHGTPRVFHRTPWIFHGTPWVWPCPPWNTKGFP